MPTVSECAQEPAPTAVRSSKRCHVHIAVFLVGQRSPAARDMHNLLYGAQHHTANMDGAAAVRQCADSQAGNARLFHGHRLHLAAAEAQALKLWYTNELVNMQLRFGQ